MKRLGRPRALRKTLQVVAALVGTVLATVVVWCLIPLRPTVAPIQPRPETRFWEMARGYRIAYQRLPAKAVAGASSGAPIVFLHGGPGGYVHSSIVRTLSPLAERGHDLYFYDQVGSGLSDRLASPRDYSFLGHVADLHEIVSRRIAPDGGRVILIGHSYGGFVAAEYLALHPDRVERLVLSSPAEIQPALFDDAGRWVNETKYPVPPTLNFVAPLDVPLDGLRFWPPRALAAMALAVVNVKLMDDPEADGVLNRLAADFTRGMVCDPQHVQPEEGGAGFYSHGWSGWYGDLEDPRPVLGKRDQPALVLQGACDMLPYAGTYEYVDLLPRARYHFIEGAGHILWWDRPAEYLQAIDAFLAEPLP